MSDNLMQYKTRLAQYLAGKGISPPKGKNYHCIAPGHTDSDPSMTFFETGKNGELGNRVKCNACGFSGDIFDCAQAITGLHDFPDLLADVKETLGELKPVKAPQVKKQPKTKYVPLTREEAKKVYTDEAVLKLANFILNQDKSEDSDDYKDLEIISMHPYYNAEKKIDIMVVRFDYEQKGKIKKDVLTMYYTGKFLKAKAYPVLLYNRDKLASEPDKNIVFHEGEKCCDYAIEQLPDFIPTTWNGGSAKINSIEGLEVCKGRNCYFVPDDDTPGLKAAQNLKIRLKKEQNVELHIVPEFPKARKIKKKGADIVEILQCYTPDEITQQILGSKGDEPRSGKTQEVNVVTGSRNPEKKMDVEDTINHIPGHIYDDGCCVRSPVDSRCDDNSFQILGIGSDDQAYFLDATRRMKHYSLDSLNPTKLVNIAGLQHWKTQVGGHPDSKQWLELVDELMYVCKQVDFDVDRLRGRGAWRTKSGDISYFDGKTITGKVDPDWTFVRRPQKKIGIGHPETTLDVRQEIFNCCKNFTWSQEHDIVRSLAWAALAPFGGALKWRPAANMTGKSGTGKSTLFDHVINPIACAEFFSGTETTEPGMRETLGLDSYAITIDEADPGPEKRDQERFSRILSGIRTMTTDNSPKTAKGTGGRGAIIYRMRSMCMLGGINASFSNIAEDNRIIRINLTPRKNLDTFAENIKRMKKLLTFGNCQGIRSFVWSNLGKIIKTGERLEFIIQKQNSMTARFAAGESILLAAFMHVFEDWDNISDESFLSDYTAKFYENQPQEPERDETEEIMERLLDEVVTVDGPNDKHTIRHVLLEMKKFSDREFDNNKNAKNEDVSIKLMQYPIYKNAIEQCGLAIHKPTGELFIANNHHMIMKIVNTGKGYHRLLARHKNIIAHNGDLNPAYSVDSAVKRGVVVGGYLNY